jgi:hypothetical protein
MDTFYLHMDGMAMMDRSLEASTSYSTPRDVILITTAHTVNNSKSDCTAMPVCSAPTDEVLLHELTNKAWFRFQILPHKFTMQNSYFPSHQNVGIYMEY